MRPNLRPNPADNRETPGLGQTVGGRPVVDHLTLRELVGLWNLTRWAAEGCLHANRTGLAAHLMRDAEWLNHVIVARAEYMAGAGRV
jgi:hypothetical protein